MTTKQVDLSAVVGKDFDMEFYSSITPDVKIIAKLDEIIKGDIFDRYLSGKRLNTVFCRPRLNKAQVLDDYSGLPDGVAWGVRAYDPNHESMDNLTLTTSGINEIIDEGYEIEWVKPIGLHPDYAEQAKEWGYPVVEL